MHNKGPLEDDEKVDVALLKRVRIMVVMLFLLVPAQWRGTFRPVGFRAFPQVACDFRIQVTVVVNETKA